MNTGCYTSCWCAPIRWVCGCFSSQESPAPTAPTARSITVQVAASAIGQQDQSGNKVRSYKRLKSGAYTFREDSVKRPTAAADHSSGSVESKK